MIIKVLYLKKRNLDIFRGSTFFQTQCISELVDQINHRDTYRRVLLIYSIYRM